MFISLFEGIKVYNYQTGLGHAPWIRHENQGMNCNRRFLLSGKPEEWQRNLIDGLYWKWRCRIENLRNSEKLGIAVILIYYDN